MNNTHSRVQIFIIDGEVPQLESAEVLVAGQEFFCEWHNAHWSTLSSFAEKVRGHHSTLLLSTVWTQTVPVIFVHRHRLRYLTLLERSTLVEINNILTHTKCYKFTRSNKLTTPSLLVYIQFSYMNINKLNLGILIPFINFEEK